MTVTDAFAELFQGRTDAYCWRHPDGRYEAVRQSLTADHWDAHLNGHAGSLLVYPQRPDGTVVWGCVDIDLGQDLLVLAANLQAVLAALHIPSYIELTKGKGYHVWVFAEDWVPASTMRRALLVANEVAGSGSKEINPKQEHLDEGQVGNAVNLPYPSGWHDTGKRAVLNSDGTGPLPLLEFLGLVEPVGLATLETVAALYKPPVPTITVKARTPILDVEADIEGTPLWYDLTPLGRLIHRDGPLPDPIKGTFDRSTALYKLAKECAKSRFGWDDALKVIWSADAQPWGGKWHERRDGLQQAQRQIVAAYAEERFDPDAVDPR